MLRTQVRRVKRSRDTSGIWCLVIVCATNHAPPRPGREIRGKSLGKSVRSGRKFNGNCSQIMSELARKYQSGSHGHGGGTISCILRLVVHYLTTTTTHVSWVDNKVDKDSRPYHPSYPSVHSPRNRRTFPPAWFQVVHSSLTHPPTNTVL